MTDSEHNDPGEKKDRLARWIAFSGLAVSIISAVIALFSHLETSRNNDRASLLEARELLGEALDYMGGKTGTVSFITQVGPPDEKRRQSLELARRKIRQAMDKAPDFYKCHHYYGIYLEQSGDSKSALKSLQTAIDLYDDDGWPYADYANSLRSLNRQEEAVEYILEALKRAPEEPNFHRNLGLMYWDLGKKTEAYAHFKDAEQIAARRGRKFPFPDDYLEYKVSQKSN